MSASFEKDMRRHLSERLAKLLDDWCDTVSRGPCDDTRFIAAAVFYECVTIAAATYIDNAKDPDALDFVRKCGTVYADALAGLKGREGLEQEAARLVKVMQTGAKQNGS